MDYLSNYHIDHPNQHKNSHIQCDEKGHPVVNMMKNQWKLRQQYDQNQKKVIVKQILVSVEINKSKRAGLGEPQSGI